MLSQFGFDFSRFVPVKRHPHWLAKFKAAYPFLSSSPSHPAALRLVLGVGRSGTSWVSEVLAKTKTRCRFLSEPLSQLRLRLPFQKLGDHTAVEYEELSNQHPLYAAYQLLAHRQFDASVLKATKRNDVDWQICLVKEVHALLGTEGLLRAWNPPTTFLLRDPIYVADSLFSAQSLGSIYLDHEVRAVQKGAFLERFVPRRRKVVKRAFAGAERMDERLRTILSKVICIHLLQEMFSMLAQEFPCATTIRYEEFCENPRPTFQSAAESLSVKWDEATDAYLCKTTQADPLLSDPYSIMRNTAEQKARPFTFLSSKERSLCRSALEGLEA